jgi:predicted nucleic acid-binding protein
MRIFLDANILFSAARSDGAMRQFLHALLAAGHELHVDTYVVEEARRNLVAKERRAEGALDDILSRVAVATLVADKSLQKGLPLPEKDQPVLVAAIRLKCDALVTGDRTHFGALYGQSLHGVAIHSPRSLAEAVLG